MNFRLTSLQSRIAFFHLRAILIAAVLVPLANYLVINQSADQFEVRSLRDHAARYLSAGQRRRLALARLPGDSINVTIIFFICCPRKHGWIVRP